tara:strand:- start:380 stop:607 length:228 start_codon:yes stop_codon:yes gene_type:complete
MDDDPPPVQSPPRLERIIYFYDNDNVYHKNVRGIFEGKFWEFLYVRRQNYSDSSNNNFDDDNDDLWELIRSGPVH